MDGVSRHTRHHLMGARTDDSTMCQHWLPAVVMFTLHSIQPFICVIQNHTISPLVTSAKYLVALYTYNCYVQWAKQNDFPGTDPDYKSMQYGGLKVAELQRKHCQA